MKALFLFTDTVDVILFNASRQWLPERACEMAACDPSANCME